MHNIRYIKLCSAIFILTSYYLLTVTAEPTEETIITGIVSKVRDGDTVEVGEVPIRLNGVSAPELNENLGRNAKLFMTELILGRKIRCILTGERSYDRLVGTCFTDNQDIGTILIEAGLAIDCPKYSGGRYKKFETKRGREQIKLPRYCYK